jgi:hypothetical protein
MENINFGSCQNLVNEIYNLVQFAYLTRGYKIVIPPVLDEEESIELVGGVKKLTYKQMSYIIKTIDNFIDCGIYLRGDFLYKLFDKFREKKIPIDILSLLIFITTP